jgi:GYF domain 2
VIREQPINAGWRIQWHCRREKTIFAALEIAGVTMPDWYICDDGLKTGPIGRHAALTRLETKHPARVLVWRQGLKEWVPLREVPEFTSVFPREPALFGQVVSAMRHPQTCRPAASSERTDIRQQKNVPGAGRGSAFPWAQAGALIGLMIFGADLLFQWSGTLGPWSDAGGIGNNLGYLCHNVGLAMFAGLIAGTIRDAFNRKSVQSDAGPLEPSPQWDRRPGNVIAAHWRGELPLWVSYWVFGVVGNIIIAAIPAAAIAVFKADEGYNPLSIFSASTLMWAAIVATAVWQTVGVWRSATRYAAAVARAGANADDPPRPVTKLAPLWAGLAKAVVVLSCMRLLASLGTEGLPQLSELYKIAFRDDPDIAPYAIRIMRGGTEAEIVGGFKYGLTEDFTAVINAARQLKVVHLDSVGGRLGEGEKLFAVIREHGLNTYVASRCLSACTLAFAGGRQRFLLKGATLGFHKGGFPGVSDGEFDSLQHKVFVAAGFDGRFIDKALSTPHSDMWMPSTEVLLAARVVTGVTDGTMFAASGHGANFTKEAAATSLARATPVFQAIHQRFPAQFSLIIDDYYAAIQTGKTEAEAVKALRSRVLPFIASLIPQADDDVLVDYNRILIDQYRYLYAKNPSACYAYATGVIPQTNYHADVPSELAQREQAVEERVIQTADRRPRSSSATATPLFAKLRKTLIAKGFTEADFNLLESTAVEKSKHAQYCRMSILFFSEIGRLHAPDNAAVLRKIFASK